MNWIALMPAVLTAAEARCLQEIERLGSYFDTGSLDTDLLATLETREFLSAHRSERYGGALIYEVSETGRLWLRRATENTREYQLADELTALFNSFDEAAQWRFAKFVAMQLDMELHPAVEDAVLDE